MISLVLWFFAAFGFAFVVGYSKISLPVRVALAGLPPQRESHPGVRPLIPVLGPLLVALAECPGCLGWWAGFVVGLLWPALVSPLGLALVPAALLLAFATSGVNLLFAKWAGLIS